MGSSWSYFWHPAPLTRDNEQHGRQLHNQAEAPQIPFANIYIFTSYKPSAMSIIQFSRVFSMLRMAHGVVTCFVFDLNNHHARYSRLFENCFLLLQKSICNWFSKDLKWKNVLRLPRAGEGEKILIKSFTRQKGNNENRLMASGVEVREGNLEFSGKVFC